MKKFTNKPSGYTKLMQSPTSTIKVCDINPNTVVLVDSESNGWSHCTYKTFVGYIETKYLDIYEEGYPKDCIDLSDIETSDNYDAAQYVVWENQKQTNMCGELSCCYVLGVPKLSEFLTKWEADNPTLYKSIFGEGKARGTGEDELVDLLAIYGAASETLQKSYQYYTPDLLKRLTGAIVSVNIEGQYGRFVGGGILHWVVVTKVNNERMGFGSVEVYNPFPNRIETYSYKEFINSAHAPYGVKLI